VILFKAAKVSDFGGVSLSASFSTTVMVQPNVPDAQRLHNWYETLKHQL